MKHIFYSYGNPKRISWVIQTEDTVVNQSREHAEIYLDKVTCLQSKYIALHVGMFWGIGTFIIKNDDSLLVKLDDKAMYEHLSLNKNNLGRFIEERTRFIKQLVIQRKLRVIYELISKEENLAGKII